MAASAAPGPGPVRCDTRFDPLSSGLLGFGGRLGCVSIALVLLVTGCSPVVPSGSAGRRHDAEPIVRRDAAPGRAASCPDRWSARFTSLADSAPTQSMP